LKISGAPFIDVSPKYHNQHNYLKKKKEEEIINEIRQHPTCT